MDTTLDTEAHPWLAKYPPDIDWFQTFEPRPLWCLIDDAAAQRPHGTATNFLGKTITYAELHAATEQAARGLNAIGVTKGTKVGLLLPNSPTFIIYYYAALKLGAVVVNFNPLYTVEELAFQVSDSETDVMVTLDLSVLFDKTEALLTDGVLKRAVVASFVGLLPSTKAVLFRMFKRGELANPAASAAADKVVMEDDLLAGGTDYKAPDLDPMTDLAVLQYTGGTTGTPKGAMLTHANLSIQTAQVQAWAPTLEDGRERMFGALPFFHVFAMTVVMNLAIARKSEIVIMPRFVLDDALKLITKTKPTIMPGVPTLFNAMLNHPKIKTFDLTSLEFCISGGAALPLEVKHAFEGLTGCKLVEGYGLSETAPVAACNPVNGPVKEGSIGVPVPQTRISLRDLEDPEREVARGDKGEICIAGPQVMKGYWNRPDETADAFVGEFFRTGDVAVMDEDGFFFIVDRIKDLIICSGYNVYPRRVEDAIYAHPAVAEVSVIGIPDDYRGEAPKAYVKLKAGQSLTVDEMMTHLEPKLSRIEMPAAIEFRDELPKTMVGKLSKKELREEELKRHEQA